MSEDFSLGSCGFCYRDAEWKTISLVLIFMWSNTCHHVALYCNLLLFSAVWKMLGRKRLCHFGNLRWRKFFLILLFPLLIFACFLSSYHNWQIQDKIFYLMQHPSCGILFYPSRTAWSEWPHVAGRPWLLTSGWPEKWGICLQMTLTGSCPLVGSAFWMAPECLEESRTTARYWEPNAVPVQIRKVKNRTFMVG